MVAFASLKDYGPNFQIKVISSLLKNKAFLLNVRDIIDDSHFEHPGHKWVLTETLNYFDKYHTTPTLDTLKIEVKKIDNDILQTAVKEQLKLVYTTQYDDQEYVEEEFANFCKNQLLKNALIDSVDLLKSGHYDDIRLLIDNALKAGADKNLGHEYKKDIESRYRESSRKVVPTPWAVLNTLLQGGLGGGDYGLIYGGPGGGKSWDLVALGAFAGSLGYKVIHYTLELGEDYVGKRYDAYYTGISVSDVHNYQDKIKEMLEEYDDNIIIKEYPSKGASLTTIKSHIQKTMDLGFTPDLILIDYVDLLKPPSRRKEKKEEIDDLHYGTKGLAKELNLPIWSVSQVNRAGAKDEIVEGDKSAGSYEKQAIVDFGMSQSRLKKDKTEGTGRWHIQKNRYGPDGMTYNVNIDTSCGHIEVLGEYDDTEDYKNQPQAPASKFGGITPTEKNTISTLFKNFSLSNDTE
jgi:replicative DNA helicase